MWMAYCFLASARSLQLCMSHAGMKAQLMPFLLRILLLELAGLVAGRARIWHPAGNFGISIPSTQGTTDDPKP